MLCMVSEAQHVRLQFAPDSQTKPPQQARATKCSQIVFKSIIYRWRRRSNFGQNQSRTCFTRKKYKQRAYQSVQAHNQQKETTSLSLESRQVFHQRGWTTCRNLSCDDSLSAACSSKLTIHSQLLPANKVVVRAHVCLCGMMHLKRLIARIKIIR